METLTEETVTLKEVTTASNFNNKMECSYIFHITDAPEVRIPESALGQEYLMVAKDGSHAPIKVKLFSLYRDTLYSMPEVFTYASHGMTLAQFTEWYLEKNPEKNVYSELAVYYYKKVS